MSKLTLNGDDVDWNVYMRETEVAHRVRPPSFWEDDLIERFSDETLATPQPSLPWARLAGKVALRRSEVSLLFGYSGSGKSLAAGQIVLSLAAQGHRCAVLSFEMRPAETLGRMAHQFTDLARPTPRDIHGFVHWGEQKIWLWDQVSTVQPERVFAVLRYCAAELGVTHFVIDNLTKMISSDDAYDQQKQIVDKLCSLALSLGVHVLLVHHSRKGVDESRPPRKHDAAGAAAVTNLVDSVFCLWRNKPKAESATPDPREPDAILVVDKNRNGGWEGQLNLAYHARSRQFVERGYCAMDLRTFPHELGDPVPERSSPMVSRPMACARRAFLDR